MFNFDFLLRRLEQASHHILGMIFQEKCYSCYIYELANINCLSGFTS